MLTVKDTVKSYAGGAGCMCGCQGKYNETERARKVAITQILKGEWDVEGFGSTASDGIAGCIYKTDTDRNRVLYLTAEGVEKARAMQQELLEEAALGHS